MFSRDSTLLLSTSHFLPDHDWDFDRNVRVGLATFKILILDNIWNGIVDGTGHNILYLLE